VVRNRPLVMYIATVGLLHNLEHQFRHTSMIRYEFSSAERVGTGKSPPVRPKFRMRLIRR
jgi:hypothetical protein